MLVRRARQPWQDHWDIPGGFCESSEHPSATAQREVYEETGIKIRPTSFLGIWMDTYEPDESTMNVYYNAVPESDIAVTDIDATEIADLGWFAAGDIPSEIAFPHHSLSVLDAWLKRGRPRES